MARLRGEDLKKAMEQVWPADRSHDIDMERLLENINRQCKPKKGDKQ